MKRLVFSIILSLWGITVVFADTTTVSGNVINGNGLTIRLMTYTDHVTYMRQTLAVSKIADDGRFSFSINLNKTIYSWIDIEFQQAELFIQPGQHYQVEIDLKEQSISASYYDRLGLPLKIVKDDTSRLNLYIQDFNLLYNDFLLSYTDNVKARGSASSFETFIKAINLRFQKATHPYFLSFIRYKTATMQLFLRLKSRDKIGMEFIAAQPVLYENIEYMDFFHLYFEKYFLTGNKYFSYNKTFDLINGNAPLNAILDSLKADPALYDVEIRELLLLSGLKELYSASGFKRNRISSLVRELSEKSGSAETRKIANNLQLRFNRLQPGNPAPGFQLNDISEGKSYSLKDFYGKHVYIAFFESANPACQAELEMVHDLFKDYSHKVYFIAISADKDKEVLRQYVLSRDLPWLFLHYDGDIDLLENYDASTFPHFILLDDDGNVSRCPAPSPSENIRKLFDSI